MRTHTLRPLALVALLMLAVAATASAQDESRKITGSVRLHVVRSFALAIGEGSQTVVTGNAEERVTGAQSTIVGGAQTISVGGSQTTNVGGSVTTTARQTLDLHGKVVEITGDDQIVLRTGDASITMKKDGEIVISGKNITINGTRVEARASGDVVLKGSKVVQN